MTTDLLKRTVLFLLFLLGQVVVMGRIHLFGVATPLLYVYFVAMFPRHYPKWGILLWSFVLGLMVDTSTNTPGLASASMTLIAAVQPYLFELFVPRNSPDTIQPSLWSVGPTRYSYYIIILVLLYCTVFYTLELFSFFDLEYWFLSTIGSAGLTLALIFAFEIAIAESKK